MNSQIATINGLRWEENWRIENGQDSYVIPFPTLNPANIVFHGEEKFDYGHYGIHLGQEDRLTFLGAANQVITAYFIDCRRGSPTLHQRIKLEFHPNSGRTLCIPPGVAHAFDGLETVFTINNYRLFLPDPEEWAAGNTDWNLENDVINIPMDITDADLPILRPNEHEASELFYQIIASHQRATIPEIQYVYPFTEDVTLDNGQSVRLLFRQKQKQSLAIPEWKAIEGIDGVGWQKHLLLPSGEHSGFIPLLDARTFYVVDHGEIEYSHDAYGIHLGQEDRLSFLGPSNQQVQLTLVDCRQGSKTHHQKVTITFTPDPRRYLVIPPGVAHCFVGLEKVFTINRPKIFVTNEQEYQPGNDVIDWPLDRTDFPTLQVHETPASREFYHHQKLAQEELLATPVQHSTPLVLMTEDSTGNSVRVALRKRLD